MKLSTRAGVIKRNGARNIRSIRYIVKSTVGLVWWMARPRTRTIVHYSQPDSYLSPMGARWVRLVGVDHRLCSHCRSLHPMDFLAVLDGMPRWNPKEAYAEMQALIERGEAQDSMYNHMRHMQVGEGSVLLDVIHVNKPSITVTAHTWEHRDYRVGLAHLADIPDDEFERFRKWALSNLPEIEIRDRQGVALDVRYLAEVDPMVGVPNMPPGLTMLVVEEEDSGNE